MRIHDDNALREMKKNEDKSKRENNYKVKMLWMNGTKEELTFRQYYDHSCDVYNPFHINVYDSKGNYITSGCGPTIEDSYNNLITSLIQYKSKAEKERNKANEMLSKIVSVVSPLIDSPDCDSCFYR